MKTKVSRMNCFFSAICMVLIVAGLFLNPAMAQDNASAKILYLTGLNDNAVITLSNSEDAEDLATVKAYNANGLPVGTVFRTLSPGQTETIESQELPAGIRSVTIEFHGNLSCSAVVNGQNISAIEKPLTQFDFPAENTSAVVVLNPNDSQADVSIIALDKDGIEIERVTVSGLYPMESREVVLSSVLGNGTIALSSIEIISGNSIVAFKVSKVVLRSKATRSSLSFYYPETEISLSNSPKNPFPITGECTWYAYGRVIELVGKGYFSKNIEKVMSETFNSIKNNLPRHAKNWVSSTYLKGKLPFGSTPQTGCLVVWTKLSDYGHVGFVENVKGDEYLISEFNYSSYHKYGTRKLNVNSDNVGGENPIFIYLGQNPSPQTGSVSGKLHETSASGPALSGATVTCGGKSTTTDSKGAFSISGISTGWQNLKFTKTGYQSYEKGVNIVAGQTANAGDAYLVCTACGSKTDQAAFAGENYPDNTSVTGGTSFTKEWKIKNTGGTTWTSAYKLRVYRFTGGRLSTVSEKAVSGTVSPNSIYSFQVPMKAPAAQSSDKTYREEWNLVGPSGVIPVSGSQIV